MAPSGECTALETDGGEVAREHSGIEGDLKIFLAAPLFRELLRWMPIDEAVAATNS